MGSTKTPKRKISDLKPAAEILNPLEEGAPDFSRGGASVLSRSEIDEARTEADAKFEGEQRGSKKRKKTKQANALNDEVDAIFQGGISGKLPKIVKSLRFETLSTGMKLWGVIAVVNSKDLVIRLPGGPRGIVTADEASDSLSESQSIMPSTTEDGSIKKKTLHGKEILKSRTQSGNLYIQDLFTAGQLVPCVVCKLERGEENGATKDSKRIWLSLRLSLLHKGLTIDAVQEGMVMMACVKSIEDHGYILSFGLPSFSGFLPHEDNRDGSSQSKLKKGQLVQGFVSGIDRVTSVISMKIDPMLVTNNMVKDHTGLSVDLLIPGTMVNARVQAILHNGLLLSFLTYFTGMVDIFHLQDQFPCSNWQKKFSVNARLKARILYVDPMTKAVGLTLNPHLIRNKVPPMGVKFGEIFDEAQVVRVDRGFGILVEFPSKPVPTPGFVNIAYASDDSLQNLENKFKKGSKVRARVMGFRFIEGIALATLKASVLEQSVFLKSDVRPGMVLEAKVVGVDPSGALLQLSSGLKAFCPLQHMSEFGAAKPSKKFQVGAKLQFRVLGCDSSKQNITVTHKKTLVTSKLKTVTCYNDAVEGIITHGWISAVTSYGCFVNFYNDIRGYAHRPELGIDPEKEPISAFYKGQVVRCRVLRSNPAFRGLQLSFIISVDRPQIVPYIPLNVKIGKIVSGVVNGVTPTAVILDVPMEEGSIRGTILTEHLSDHHGHSEKIKSLLKPGYKFDRLLVLDIANQNLLLSAKYSLVEFARFLPSDINQLHPQSVLQGYISNIIDGGFFVQFLGGLTGFASKSKGSDNFKELKCFYIGQSVRTHILNVNEETGRISLSLKQSACFSTDASLIQAYFLEDDMMSKLNAFESGSTDINWTEDFVIGSCIEGEIQQMKEYGVIVNVKQHKDVVGFVPHHQFGGASMKISNVVRARVLDVVKSDGIVDLTLRSELMRHSELEESKQKSLTKKRRKSGKHLDLELHLKVNAVVELVKDDYLVLSLPEHESTIGFASTHDFNMWMDPHKLFAAGQKVDATVEALPNASTSGRLLLLLSCFSETGTVSNLKRLKRKVHHTGISLSYGSSVSGSQLLKSENTGNIGSPCDLSTISNSEQFERESHSGVGSLAKAEVDEENKRISLGMKESYFVNKSVTGVVPYKESVKEEGSKGTARENSNMSSEDHREYRMQALSKENDEGVTKDLEIGVFNSLGLAREVESRASVPPLEVHFDTDENVSRGGTVDKRKHLDNEPSEMGSKDDEKLTKRAKKKRKEKRELEIRAAEQKRLEGGQAPDTVDEYEQLVRASPNSSFVWIKYMAFLLSIADVEKARAIAERALQTINFREEEEKLNVWVAFFNLENVYGIPPNEAVLKVFQRALQYCDPKKVHLALLGMYERTGQQEMADQLLKAMTKKFKTSAKVWLRNMQNLLKQRSDAAEMVLNRALVSIPHHKHIKFISQAAVLEFKIGSAERARMLFEGVLRNYPKRTDLWSVYLDQRRCICHSIPFRKGHLSGLAS